MSTEADTNNAGEQGSPVPKTPKKKPVIAKDDNEAIADRLQRAIDCIPDDAKKKTQLYNNVVAHIRKTNLRRAWVDTSLNKMFMGWSEFAEPNERPKLDYMIAAIAVYDMFGVEHQKFALEVTKRGLREWVNNKLEVPVPTATSSKSTAPEAPKIKTEPGSQSAELNKVRQSIEGGNASTIAYGSKRPAPSAYDRRCGAEDRPDGGRCGGYPLAEHTALGERGECARRARCGRQEIHDRSDRV